MFVPVGCQCQLGSLQPLQTHSSLVERLHTCWGLSWQQLRTMSGAQVVPHSISDSNVTDWHLIVCECCCTPLHGSQMIGWPPSNYLDHLSLQLQQGMLVLQDVAVPFGHRPHVPHKGLRLPLQLLGPRLDDAVHIHALQGGNRGGLLPGVAAWCAGQGTAASGRQPWWRGGRCQMTPTIRRQVEVWLPPSTMATAVL